MYARLGLRIFFNKLFTHVLPTGRQAHIRRRTIMAITTAQKLKIKEGATLLTINAPADFKKQIGKLPAGATITDKAGSYDQVHWFVLNKAQMEKEMSKVLKLVKSDVICWIYYPKGSSKIQTDLTRDKGWEKLLQHKELQWLTLVSLDDTWSTFAMRLQNEADKKKAVQPAKDRPILDYIDPVKKIVRLPDDFAKALQKNKKQEAFFNTLSFTNKKEYVEWIVTAKREDTRLERINGTIERLVKEWKNPRNV